MTKKKIIIIVSVIAICCLTVIICMYGRNIIRLIKRKESIDYNRDLLHIVIKNIDYYSGSNRKEVRIENKEDIEKILNYLNSLELIKEKKPNYKINSRDGLSQVGYFTINFYGSNSDGITFTTEYLTIYHGGHDWDYTSYYIVDSGYNPEDKTSKFSDFLDELISEYVEE